MKKLFLILLAFVLAISVVGSVSAKPAANSTFFEDNFEAGTFSSWSDQHGLIQVTSIYSGYPLCDIIQQAGVRCADAFFHNLGEINTAAYLLKNMSADPLSEAFYATWTSKLSTSSTSPVNIFKLNSEAGASLMYVQVRLYNGNTQARVSCRNIDTSTFKSGPWKPIPDTLGREAYAYMSAQWFRGVTGSETNPGLCILVMSNITTGASVMSNVYVNTSTYRMATYQIGAINGGVFDSETYHDFDEFQAITE